MENVTQASYLQRACESQGVFCLVYKDVSKFYFQGPRADQLNELPITDRDKYNGMIMGLAGFFIGRPSLPDTSNPMVCYDAACPNCYQDRVITKRLQFIDTYMVECPTCHRTYNLDDRGYVYKTPENEDQDPAHNRRLIRYQVHYYPNQFTLVVSN